VLLLTETDRERARHVAERVTARMREQLGLEVRFGVAAFPAEEVTLSGLLDRAEDDLDAAGKWTPSLVEEQAGAEPTAIST